MLAKGVSALKRWRLWTSSRAMYFISLSLQGEEFEMEIRLDDPSSPVTSAKLVGFNLNRERYCYHCSHFLLSENITHMYTHAQRCTHAADIFRLMSIMYVLGRKCIKEMKIGVIFNDKGQNNLFSYNSSYAGCIFVKSGLNF